MAEVVRAEHWTGKKQPPPPPRARSGFSDGKLKIECELALCAAAQGESRRRHGARRSRQDLKLLSNDWLGARTEACSRYLILPRHA